MRGALAKITWVQVLIIGAVVCAIIGGSLYFLMIKKQQEEIAQLNATLTQTKSAAGQLPAAIAARKQARANLRAAERRLNFYQNTKMIPLSLTSEVEKYHTMVRLWREQAEVLGPLMERHIASTGVIMEGAAGDAFANLLTGQRFRSGTGAGIISVPKPPETPAGISPGWYTINLGSVTVRTTRGLPHVISFLRSFTRAPRLVAVGAPSISGESPNLTVTVPLTVYYLVKGGDSGGGAPAAGGGMMGGPGMGMGPGMGGPGMGGPGMGGPGMGGPGMGPGMGGPGMGGPGMGGPGMGGAPGMMGKGGAGG